MRTFTLLLGFIVLSFSQAQAQQAIGWEFGVFVEHGRDWYSRDYYNWGELPDYGFIQHFSTYSSRGAGFYAERHINPHFSALAQISYLQKKMFVDLFGEPSRTASSYITREMHHRGAIDAGMRWYVNPNSNIQFFLDGRLGANMFIAAVLREGNLEKTITRDAFGYNRITPVASGSVGAKWGRLSVSAEYKQDLVAAKRARTGTGITSRGVVGKVAFAFLRAGRQ